MGDRTVCCQAVSCAMRGIVVTTDKDKCLGCGADLQPALDLQALFKGIYGDG